MEKFYRFTIIGTSDYPRHVDLTVENSLRDIAFTAIWMTRNKLIFQKEDINLCALFKTKLRQEIKQKYYVAKDNEDGLALFTKVWCKNNALVTVINNQSLVINL